MGTTSPPSNIQDSIQRTLFTAPQVYVYAVPPLITNKGYAASQWTQNDPIFVAKIRVTETATPHQSAPQAPSTKPTPTTRQQPPNSSRATPPPASPRKDSITIEVALEDPSSAELFAAAPYNHPTAVQPCTDSARFFAIRVVGDGGRKATLGIAFEDRSVAFDFGIALQEARKVLGLTGAAEGGKGGPTGKGGIGSGNAEVKRNYSLKEGEMIEVDVGRRGAAGRNMMAEQGFSPSANGALLPPPPSAVDGKLHMSDDVENVGFSAKVQGPTVEEEGFDDGEFGEFQ